MCKGVHFKSIWDSRGQAIFIIMFTEIINLLLIKVDRAMVDEFVMALSFFK